jgi:autotransporter-associated beta strand protein
VAVCALLLAWTLPTAPAALAAASSFNVSIETGSPTSEAWGGGGAMPWTFTPTHANETIDVADLESHLTTQDVVVNAAGPFTGGSQNGDISVAAPLTSTAAHSLTLEAAGNVQFTQNVALGGGLTVQPGSSGATTISASHLGAAQQAFTGPVTLGVSSTLSVPDGGSLSIPGDVSLGSNVLTIDGAGTLAGAISGTGAVTKLGSGTLVLAGNSDYTGQTLLSAGVLEVDGSDPSSTFSLAGGTLTGTGAVGPISQGSGAGTIDLGGTLLQSGSVRLGSASTVSVTLDGSTPGVDYGQLGVQGTVTLNGAALNIALTPGFTVSIGQSFTIIDNRGNAAVGGTFAGLAEGQTVPVGDVVLGVSYRGGSGNDVTLTVKKFLVGVSLSASTAASTAGDPVTFKVTVNPFAPASVMPTGKVTFHDGQRVLGVVPLKNAAATFETARLAAGTHQVVATYDGDANFATASSQPLEHLVRPLPSPRIGALSQTARRWREPGHGGRRSLPAGTVFKLRLNVAAAVVFTFTEPGAGREVHGRCVASTTHDRRSPRCTLLAGRMTIHGGPGRNLIRFDGHLAGRRWLARGTYTALVTARNAAGRSIARSLSFTIA